MLNELTKRGFYTHPDYFCFFSIMRNAYVKSWTGILFLQWDFSKIEGFFRIEDQEKLEGGKGYVFVCEGKITNVTFSLKTVMDLFNNEIALSNLLLLIRVFEGVADLPKLKAAAVYTSADEALQIPQVMRVSCNTVECYSILANEQALKDQNDMQQWPDVIE